MATLLTTLFFNEIRRLERALPGWPPKGVDDNGAYTLASNNHECAPENCFRRDDGLWETPPESYGRKLRKFVFIWRTHPNYCCAGRPWFSCADEAEYLRESETEKVLLVANGYEFVWGWDTFVGPTRIVWGMKPGNKMFLLRKDGEVVIETPVKCDFKAQVRVLLGDPHCWARKGECYEP